jgi:hypothetical protein
LGAAVIKVAGEMERSERMTTRNSMEVGIESRIFARK